jgi:hypothetical protein
VDLVCGSVDLISRRISSIDLEMKDDSVRSWRRMDLMRSSRVRWKRLSMIEEDEEPAIEASFKKKKKKMLPVVEVVFC